MRTVVRIFVALGCFLSLSDIARAQQQAYEVAEQWGLRGTWALHCDRLPSPENGHVTYAWADGAFVYRRDSGTLQSLGEIISAALADDGGIELTINFKKFAAIHTSHIVKNAEGQVRVIWNRSDKGKYTVKDGKMTGSGWPSLALTYCKAGS